MDKDVEFIHSVISVLEERLSSVFETNDLFTTEQDSEEIQNELKRLDALSTLPTEITTKYHKIQRKVHDLWLENQSLLSQQREADIRKTIAETEYKKVPITS